MGLWAQVAAFPRKAYVWPDAPVWDAQWSADTSQGTLVLEDERSIRIRNAKPQFMAVFFERRQVIRFATMRDIVTNTRFALPESLDPFYDQRLTPWTERNLRPSPQWLNVRLDHFAARVVRPDGSWTEVPVTNTIERSEVRAFRTIETAWNYHVDLQDIKPGDVVEVRWKYMVPYDSNWPSSRGWREFAWMDNWARLTNWRFFFHGTLPIRHQRTELLYHVKHALVLGGTAAPERNEENGEVVARWEYRDLPDCLDEVGIRPVEDLPYVTVRMQPDDPRYWRRDRLSGIPYQQPYWLQVVRYREARAFWWRQVSLKRVPDRQNRLVQEFVEQVTAGLPDTLGALRMARIHDRIAERFTYQDDRLWYLDLDEGLQRLGDQVNEQRIREISRYDLYSKLINALHMDYSTAYVLDKRIGALDDRYTTPLWDSEFLFGLHNGQQVMWMHPKRTRQGLLADELPFYWQGTAALAVDLDLLLEDIPPPAVFVDLPEGEPRDNVRGTEYVLDIDVDQPTVEAKARVLLSGQFSTLGRAAYLDAPIDSTVDPRYGKRAQDLQGVQIRSWTNDSVDTDPPFRFRAWGEVQLPQPAHAQADSMYRIDLGPFFAHVAAQGFMAEGRELPFHWDYPQDDHFVVDLYFRQRVELVDSASFDRSFSTPNATLERTVHRLSDGGLRVESRLHVTGEREAVRDAAALEQLLQGALSEDAVLQFRRSPSTP